MPDNDSLRQPRVGVGVLVLRDQRVLLGRRRGAHGADTWAPPGGHLEFGESIEACAARELEEETGLLARDITGGPHINTVFAAEALHYLTVFAIAHSAIGEPVVREPGKCAAWQWFAWDNLPAPLFEPLRALVATGFVPRSS